ncbi:MULTISPECIES: class I SAM-dependent methyltransferase [Asticcacaulis]|uniref:class I SAM-dependent DNA methyltransferase n=1 Tax=Asticcacaulis TaxID=76890 RepID=UPI001AE4E4A6|nr:MULTISPECIES: class I SAM-dependent methyltransferase [Asticcacaulis]MBP2158784.1 malonyl-CoA O-methyltransferase [Asticcacaulis solisilvae]MDR6799830.1 malonyl-CoA O-methyltransferase [Asticcacaulis sp. BE141]
MTQSESPISTTNRESYDRWAELYDGYVNSTVAIDDLYFPPVYAHLSGLRVLDIGCGTGRHTIRLARAGNRVTGIDLSPGMLAVAREKLSSLDVALIEGDILTAPPPGPFDAVVTALVLEHINDPAVFFARVADLLTPGGGFYISEIHPDRIAGGTQANFVDRDGRAVKLQSFAHSEADIRATASQAGLRLLTHTDVFGGEALAGLNRDWIRHVGRAMIRIWTFEKPAGP